MDIQINTSHKENPVKSGEASPISKLLENYKPDPLNFFNALAISSPNRDYGPPPTFTPCFGSIKPFNPYLS